MENLRAISGGDWNPSNEMCSEEADFMAQLLGNCSLPNEVSGIADFAVSSSTFSWPGHWSNLNSTTGAADGTLYYSSDEANNNSICSFSQGGSSILPPFSSSVSPEIFVTDNYLMAESNNISPILISSTDVMEGAGIVNPDIRNGTAESENVLLPVLEPRLVEKDKVNSSSESKKRARVPQESQKKRCVKAKNRHKLDDDSENDNNNINTTTMLHGQSSSSYFPEDDLNGSQEMTGTTSSKGYSTGKARASRGSATDPQSLYARRRRERINERLRILQNLVPNGTKVDISTMLDEAVQYVKFLQLQIKMLSSDELWMYAPIAYNGMDIGLDSKFPNPIPKPQS